MAQKCNFIKEDGTKCGAHALKGEDRCIFHSDSDAAEKARQLALWVRQQKLESTPYARVWILNEQIRKIKKDKTLSLYRKTYLLLAIFDEMDKLEAKIKDLEQESKDENAQNY